ncbi:nitrite reductase small subunit NirD [Paludifilum halophilum]|uniref:Nitrite reductase (NAD(P)H) small subunit n=1 Tax=Paludifilum halophilum TaxID=1642702 RepID=A0A235B449_9BACL|nr:nitrite reductase small subunit NirD [Paludifilum halophilum]OYD07078.1 nitrite reductase (NAD(P)H) small subunit [Paludifilum halophilum]
MREVTIGKVTEIPERTGRVVHIGNLELAVFRLSGGEIRAVENRCPHRGGPLAEGMISGGYVYCPLHEWKIRLKDGKVQDPDSGCVQTYPVIVEGDEVKIGLRENEEFRQREEETGLV